MGSNTYITIGKHKFDLVLYTYFRFNIVSTDNDITHKICASVVAANKSSVRQELYDLRKEADYSYCSITRPSENWTLSSSDEIFLATFKWKILRQTIVLSCETAQFFKNGTAQLLSWHSYIYFLCFPQRYFLLNAALSTALRFVPLDKLYAG